MIYLSDFQPLSIAKIKKFSSTTGFLQKIFSDEVHAILIEEVTVQTTLRDGASFRRLTSIIIGLKLLPKRPRNAFFAKSSGVQWVNEVFEITNEILCRG